MFQMDDIEEKVILVGVETGGEEPPQTGEDTTPAGDGVDNPDGA